MTFWTNSVRFSEVLLYSICHSTFFCFRFLQILGLSYLVDAANFNLIIFFWNNLLYYVRLSKIWLGKINLGLFSLCLATFSKFYERNVEIWKFAFKLIDREFITLNAYISKNTCFSEKWLWYSDPTYKNAYEKFDYIQLKCVHQTGKILDSLWFDHVYHEIYLVMFV